MDIFVTLTMTPLTAQNPPISPLERKGDRFIYSYQSIRVFIIYEAPYLPVVAALDDMVRITHNNYRAVLGMHNP